MTTQCELKRQSRHQAPVRRSGGRWCRYRVRGCSGTEGETEQQDWRCPEYEAPRGETLRRTLEQLVRYHLLSVGLEVVQGGAWAHFDVLSVNGNK